MFRHYPLKVTLTLLLQYAAQLEGPSFTNPTQAAARGGPPRIPATRNKASTNTVKASRNNSKIQGKLEWILPRGSLARASGVTLANTNEVQGNTVGHGRGDRPEAFHNTDAQNKKCSGEISTLDTNEVAQTSYIYIYIYI